LAGPTQQIQRLSFGVGTKLPHDPVAILGAVNNITASCNNSHFPNFDRSLID
jgi:hypothetical protein